jgi:hypothetical protein
MGRHRKDLVEWLDNVLRELDDFGGGGEIRARKEKYARLREILLEADGRDESPPRSPSVRLQNWSF